MGGDPFLPFAAALGFFAVLGAGWALTTPSGNARSKKRVQSLTGRARIRGRRQASALDAAAQRRRQVQESLKEMEERQRASRRRAVSLKARLQQAGLQASVRTFWIVSAVCGAVSAFGAVISGQSLLIAAVAAFAGGVGFPRWVLTILRGRRTKKFTNEFANALDVIVRGVKSGLPLNECLKIVANESPDPVRTEFQLFLEGQSMGVSVEEGLRRMFERVPLPELNFFAVVLIIQQKTGGNLAEALNNLATVLRSRKMLREKIAALSGEAKASALIIGALPPGVMAFVYLTTPTYMATLFTDPRGNVLLGFSACWMAAGIFIMRKMINFRV
ncbi:MAG: type II secretion system F family protein [Caulobacterales bacterium]|nr:type II secretion system F family protein [Caulobacterales bacterium]